MSRKFWLVWFFCGVGEWWLEAWGRASRACWPVVGRAACSSQILLSCAKDAAEVSFGSLQEIDMRRREGSGLTVARLHRLALVVAAKLLVSFAEGTAEARAH